MIALCFLAYTLFVSVPFSPSILVSPFLFLPLSLPPPSSEEEEEEEEEEEAEEEGTDNAPGALGASGAGGAPSPRGRLTRAPDRDRDRDRGSIGCGFLKNNPDRLKPTRPEPGP